MSETEPVTKTKQYCAFWYPTIFHHTNTISPERRYSIMGVDISDNANYSERLYLNINEDSDGNIDFELYKKNDDNQKVVEKNIHLVQEKQSNNGFVVYSCEDQGFDLDKVLFKSIFYHHSKSLRHVHEVNSDSDSSLSAMVIKDAGFRPEDILKQDNCVIQYYLKQYEELFGVHYAKMVSKRNQFYDKMIKTFRVIRQDDFFQKLRKMDKETRLKFDEEIHEYYNTAKCMVGIMSKPKEYSPKNHGICYYKRLRRKIQKLEGMVYEKVVTKLKELCEHAMIEYTYCQTLLNSKYNTRIKPNIEFTPEEICAFATAKDNTINSDLRRKDMCRKMANNIYNSVRYINCITYKCSNYSDEHVRYVLQVADKTTNRSKWWTIFFGLISIISLIVALLSCE